MVLDLLAACVKAQSGGCSWSLADARDARFACGLCQGSARRMLMMLALLASYGKGQSG